MRKGSQPFAYYLEVEWEDAASNDGWADKDTDLGPEIILSRGWLVKEHATYITLANTIHKESDHQFGGTQTIPRGNIVKCRELKVSNASIKLRRKLHPEPGAEEVHREPRKG